MVIYYDVSRLFSLKGVVYMGKDLRGRSLELAYAREKMAYIQQDL